MHVHYFGSSKHPLLGVYHPPRNGGASSAKAALLCPPIGHEYLRTHWALRRVAKKIARTGVPVMRFDYRGLGDSSGEIWQISALNQWIDDIVLAADELQSHSGCRSITLVGLRFGAALAALAAQRMTGIRQVILWEPVLDGATYLKAIRRMHAQMLDLWVCPMTTEDSPQAEEILGAVYQRQLLNEIEATHIDTALLAELGHTFIGATIDGEAISDNDPRQSTGAVTDLADWHDLRFIETAWLPATSPSVITETVSDTCLASSVVGVG